MNNDRQALGRFGEDLAADLLQQKGYEIITRNWRCARGEVDLVAQIDDVLVFVEVKTRRGKAFGLPEEALTPHKSRRLLELGRYYLYTHDLDDIDWRIDLVAVELDQQGKLLRCEHVPDVYWGW